VSNKHILVVGGAGYIGSHMVNRLVGKGWQVTVLDDLSYGFKQAVGSAKLIIGDLGDNALLDKIFSNNQFSAVMHFASFIQVGESVTAPDKYYDNNVARTITLLNAMLRHKVDYFIFSSTAATFGDPVYVPIDEKHPQLPINPYGRTKLMVEHILADYKEAYGLHYGVLRYFNAAGASPQGHIGECHDPETHLIPLILQAASKRRKSIKVFGTDYDTPDGSCLRDYIHVDDLADAHTQLAEYLWRGGEESAFNLGTGRGYSVLEVIDAAKRVTGKDILVDVEGRRSGDPSSLIADGSKARAELGWKPERSDIDTIIADAWAWEQKLCNGHPFNSAE